MPGKASQVSCDRPRPHYEKGTEGCKPPLLLWVPPNGNFPGIDSALVLKDRIFAFQVTISSSHKSPITGLESLSKMLPPKLKKLPWRVVFVGAETDRIRPVAEHWDGELCFPEGRRLPVAWAEVGPVMKGVAYTACRFVGSSSVF